MEAVLISSSLAEEAGPPARALFGYTPLAQMLLIFHIYFNKYSPVWKAGVWVLRGKGEARLGESTLFWLGDFLVLRTCCFESAVKSLMIINFIFLTFPSLLTMNFLSSGQSQAHVAV